VKGFFSIELLFVAFLLPYWFYLFESPKIPLLRETETYTQDAAQLYMYGFEPNGTFRIWLDGVSTKDCEYVFKYCTFRYFNGGEHRICAAECLP
jgi:hypothetical protein